MATKEIERIKEKIIPILKKYKVTKAGIFGSFARGEQKKKSDVDILIKVDNGTDLFTLIRLRRILQETIRKKVDIIEYEAIRKELKERILNDEIPIIR